MMPLGIDEDEDEDRGAPVSPFTSFDLSLGLGPMHGDSDRRRASVGGAGEEQALVPGSDVGGDRRRRRRLLRQVEGVDL